MTWQVWITRSPFHLFPKEGERAEDDDSDCWKCKQPVWRFGTLGEVLSNYKMKKSRWSGRVQLTSQLTGLIKIATPYSNLWMGKLYKKKRKKMKLPIWRGRRLCRRGTGWAKCGQYQTLERGTWYSRSAGPKSSWNWSTRQTAPEPTFDRICKLFVNWIWLKEKRITEVTRPEERVILLTISAKTM